MKRVARLTGGWLLSGFLLAGTAAATAPATFTGVIHDNRCVGPNCARQCPVIKDPKYTLQTEDEALVLSDQKTAARYNGKRVVVTGRITGTNKLQVVSIVPAGAPATVPAR
jgi:hypothetical protein